MNKILTIINIALLTLTILLGVAYVRNASVVDTHQARVSKLETWLESVKADLQQAVAERDRLQQELDLALEALARLREELTAKDLQLLEALAQAAIEPEPAEESKGYELPPLVVPENLRQLASSAGLAKLRFYEFSQKYPDGPPPLDSPEYPEYVKEFDIVMAELTPMALAAQELGVRSDSDMDAETRAAFSTEMYASSLGLNEGQAKPLQDILLGAHQEILDQGLNHTARPLDDKAKLDAWNQARYDHAHHTWQQMENVLNKEQQELFLKMYGGNFLYQLSFSLPDRKGKKQKY